MVRLFICMHIQLATSFLLHAMWVKMPGIQLGYCLMVFIVSMVARWRLKEWSSVCIGEGWNWGECLAACFTGQESGYDMGRVHSLRASWWHVLASLRCTSRMFVRSSSMSVAVL